MTSGRQANGRRWVGYSDCDQHICTEGGPCKTCRIEALEAKNKELLDKPCSTCGQDERIARIGKRLGFRPDVGLLEIRRLQAKLKRVEAKRKDDCVSFFHWWWNQGGTNTGQGYDDWKALNTEKEGVDG